VVFATGMATEFGRIAHLTEGIEEGASPLQKEIRRVSRVVASLATATGIVFFAVGFILGRGFWDNFLFAVGIIIANVPEGLLPTVTLSLAMGSQRMAKKNALIRNLSSVETLGSVTVICTDKTGTLTQNQMELTKLWIPGTGEFDVPMITMDKAPKGTSTVMMIASLCNNAVHEAGRYSGDPTDVALLKATVSWGAPVAADRILEIPFDPERKRMTTIHRANGKDLVLAKGALESVLPLCTQILGDSENRVLDSRDRSALMQAHTAMTERGLRVIALGFREAATGLFMQTGEEMEKGMVLAGLLGLEDPPRPEVPAAIEKCRSAGIRILMLTGDAAGTALSIARQVGMVGSMPVTVEGPELDRIEDRVLRTRLLTEEIVFARMTPKHKMRIVSLLKDEGARVAVTGDGVNDAPALRKADVGIAMGKTGTDVAREAADIILLDDNFATIVAAIEEGRSVFENIRKFISYIFASNIPEIVPFIAYAVLRIPLPLTVMQILAIDLGTDMVPALGLGAERPTQDVMTQPPRGPKE
ncbi:MAG: cation-translocating P-type ATPase, partial [Thermodesulfovibrionales bacterium]